MGGPDELDLDLAKIADAISRTPEKDEMEALRDLLAEE